MRINPNRVTLSVGDNKPYLKKYLNVYAGKVDVIYIDPPYNTGGNVFQYNDKRDKDHWYDFMLERIELAKDYLTDTGVIMVSIDDNEHHNLRNILDKVFGSENFISNVVWLGNGSSKTKFDRGGIDYIVVYTKARKAARSLASMM